MILSRAPDLERRDPALQAVTSTVTDRDGRYRVIGLSAGDYVVAIDPGWSSEVCAGGRWRDRTHDSLSTVLSPGTCDQRMRRSCPSRQATNAQDRHHTAADDCFHRQRHGQAAGWIHADRFRDAGRYHHAAAIFSFYSSAQRRRTIRRQRRAGRTLHDHRDRHRSDQPARSAIGRGGASYFGSGSVTTDGVVPADVTITLAPPDASARLTFDAHAERPRTRSKSRCRCALPETLVIRATDWRAIVLQPDGTALVTWANVPPGQYLISVASVRSVWQVASATIDGTSVLDLPIEVRSGADITGMSIVLTDLTSPLSGAALDASQQPVAASVLLFPVDQKYWIAGSRRLTTVRSNADGRFSIPNAPPGEYYLVALASSPSESLDDPAWLMATSKLATRVTLRAGETSTRR
jgi:hypothetical protein